jgi:hypothetical protein
MSPDGFFRVFELVYEARPKNALKQSIKNKNKNKNKTE